MSLGGTMYNTPSVIALVIGLQAGHQCRIHNIGWEDVPESNDSGVEAVFEAIKSWLDYHIKGDHIWLVMC